MKLLLSWLALSMVALPLQAANFEPLVASASAPCEMEMMMDANCDQCDQDSHQCSCPASNCSLSQTTPGTNLLPSDIALFIPYATIRIIIADNEINTSHILSSLYRPPRA